MNSEPTNALLGFIPIVVISIVFVIPYWQIFRKAGYSPWLALLLFIPLVNIILIWWFAFSAWPILRRVARDPSPKAGVIYTESEREDFRRRGFDV